MSLANLVPHLSLYLYLYARAGRVRDGIWTRRYTTRKILSPRPRSAGPALPAARTLVWGPPRAGGPRPGGGQPGPWSPAGAERPRGVCSGRPRGQWRSAPGNRRHFSGRLARGRRGLACCPGGAPAPACAAQPACYSTPSMKLVSRCWISTRRKDISLRVFSKMTRGSSDWQRRQLGAITMARLLTSILVMATLAGCTNT